MIKTVEELREQAKSKNIKFYPVHRCSMCGYQCGYRINGDDVTYDSYCDCGGFHGDDKRDWEDLTRTYNMNQPENNPKINKEFLDELDRTWKFNSN